MKFLYLFIDLGSFLVPFLFSFHPKINFYKKWQFAIPPILISAFVFIIWDSYFTRIGVWGFSEKYTLGTRLMYLPIEEILFFICIPYSCLFTFYCFSLFIKRTILLSSEKWITGFLLIFLFGVGLINYDRLYTSFTFFGLGIMLICLRFIVKVKWLNLFYFSYGILLIPFCIVNGILTGTGLPEPVVWYNNHQNLGFRLGTIPFEDVFYGMLLILLCVSVFKYLSDRSIKDQSPPLSPTN